MPRETRNRTAHNITTNDGWMAGNSERQGYIMTEDGRFLRPGGTSWAFEKSDAWIVSADYAKSWFDDMLEDQEMYDYYFVLL